MAITLEFTPDQAKQLIADALAKEITPEVRDKLVKEAIESLLRHSYSDLNVLQVAFRDGARSVAEDIFREECDKPELRAKIRELAADAFEKLFENPDSRDKLLEKMTEALGSALFGSRY